MIDSNVDKTLPPISTNDLTQNFEKVDLQEQKKETDSLTQTKRPIRTRKPSFVEKSLRKIMGTATELDSPSPVEEKYSLDPNDYLLEKEIGRGACASVWLAKYLPSNKKVALKIIDIDSFERNQIDEVRVRFFFVFYKYILTFLNDYREKFKS
jgi:hypothetical protein